MLGVPGVDPKEISQFTFAVADADKAFFGKVDKAGEPAIRHSLRIAAHFLKEENYKLATIAALHDIIEDTDYKIENLYLFYPEDVADAVIALTRKEGETYKEYLYRCCENPLAIEVKLQDLQDNLLPERCKGWSPPTKRYFASLEYIYNLKYLRKE